ncbi:uncharacterized protein LOC123474515 [Daphnia magna]|uniref:uncharacterized protein LOC123474515 n=1 Tax=Daphnia magna TaxID=35525 RepID=UPI001E1BD8F1|nr:uncharacterized protein LOC123474515 [Daphnia magna]
MGTESPDVWPRTAEISFGNTEVTRHEFYECFEHDSNESDSIFDASLVARRSEFELEIGQLTSYALEFNISNSMAQAFNRGVLGSIPESDNPLVSPFTVEEINNALRATKKNKAPGRKSKEVSSLKPAAIIAYDLEKAYDLVNRDVLWEVMTAMGYPPLCLSRGIDGIEHYGKRIQVRAIERTATVYWLGPHLKNLLPQITQPRFNATHSSHPYFTTSLSNITDLLKAGIFTSSTVSNHRATYNHLIANIGKPGRTEIAKPDLDWASIWRWVAKIKGKNAELVWDFNHNQLPTKMRLNSLNLSNNDQCPLCNAGQETDDHLMLLCKEKVDISLWLRIQLTKLGCLKPLKSAINGDVGNGPNKKKILTLIQSYIITVWTGRSQNFIPAINEIQSLWSRLLHSKTLHRRHLLNPKYSNKTFSTDTFFPSYNKFLPS